MSYKIPEHLRKFDWYAQHLKWLGYDLPGVDQRRAYLRRADLIGAKLSDAYLTDADLIGANLLGADLSYANLLGADLSYANLIYANLRRANLIDANLTGANLTGANLIGADMSGAYLTGAQYDRPADAPDAATLRRLVADQVQWHPELHDQSQWGTGDPSDCGTPCCVAGWACRYGGGTRGLTVPTAATLLLWHDGLPMPRFDQRASRKEILEALRAEAQP